ncbi:hypothetical protein BDV12DRAFT_112684 [Aspergillus spectabilis]
MSLFDAQPLARGVNALSSRETNHIRRQNMPCLMTTNLARIDARRSSPKKVQRSWWRAEHRKQSKVVT